MAFDCICIDFGNNSQKLDYIKKIFPYAIVVKKISNYFEILNFEIKRFKTSHVWFLTTLCDYSNFDFNFLPEQYQEKQLHVWHQGMNKEGNTMLIPRIEYIKQSKNLTKLIDFKDINYHEEKIENEIIDKTLFDLSDPVLEFNNMNKKFYNWFVNKDINYKQIPNFFPSFWNEEKIYSFGKTMDILLIPNKNKVLQFADFNFHENFEFNYESPIFDIIFISYDEPYAEKRFNELKRKYSRAKWLKNVKGQTNAYHAAARLSSTPYFFSVFPKIDIVDTFNFDFQPNRLKHACHYIFDCYNPVIDLTYGHDGVILYNKKLVLETKEHGIDFTLSAPHVSVPILSAVNRLEDNELLSWRTSFREVIKLKHQCETIPTVESRYRLKKWCELGKGKFANWVYNGALDALDFYSKNKNNLMRSYDFDYIKNYFESKYLLSKS